MQMVGIFTHSLQGNHDFMMDIDFMVANQSMSWSAESFIIKGTNLKNTPSKFIFALT